MSALDTLLKNSAPAGGNKTTTTKAAIPTRAPSINTLDGLIAASKPGSTIKVSGYSVPAPAVPKAPDALPFDATKKGIALNTIKGIPGEALKFGKDAGNYIYDSLGQTLIPGITHDELRSKVILDTVTGVPKAAVKLAKQVITHPIDSAQAAVGGAARGTSDFITNAIINLTPTKVTGVDRESLRAAVQETLDKNGLLNNEKIKKKSGDTSLGEGFKVGGEVAPLVALGAAGEAGAAAVGAPTLAGEAAGFVGAGQTQLPLDAPIEARAKQAMHDLVTLGLFKLGSYSYMKAKSAIISGYKGAAPGVETSFNSSGHDLDRAIEAGDVPVGKVYKNKAGELQPEYAAHVVSDLAGKMDAIKPGLGKKFADSVDLSNPTPTNLDAQATAFFKANTPAGLDVITPRDGSEIVKKPGVAKKTVPEAAKVADTQQLDALIEQSRPQEARPGDVSRGTPKETLPPEKAQEAIKSTQTSAESIAPTAEAVKLYRGGGEGAPPKGTAADIIRYETKDLGNADVKAEPGIDLKKINAKNTEWLTETKAAAKEYGKVQEKAFPKDSYRVIARDGQGGVLIEKITRSEPPVKARDVIPKETKGFKENDAAKIKAQNKLDREYSSQINQLASRSSMDDMASGNFERQQAAIKNRVYGKDILLADKQTLLKEIKKIKAEKTYEGDKTAQRMVKAREKSIKIIDNELSKKSGTPKPLSEKTKAEIRASIPKGEKPLRKNFKTEADYQKAFKEYTKPMDDMIKKLEKEKKSGTPKTKNEIIVESKKGVPEKTAEVRPLEPIGKGETKTSGLSLNIAQNAIEKGLVKKFGDLPEYKTVDLKDQAKMAGELLAKDPQKAFEIAMGREKAPKDVLPEMVLDAVERAAINSGDARVLLELASSNLSTEATAMGQRIRALAERDQTSPVKVMQDVIKSREEAAMKKYKGKDMKEVKQKVVDDIKSEIKKAAPKKQDWQSFIKSIEC